MEKPTTGKKSDFIIAQQAFAEFGTQYLKEWTNQELKKYIDKPVVIPIGNYRFFVGNYIITGKTKTCWVVQQYDGKHIHDFVTKINAIVYCIKSVQNKTDYRDILELDRRLGYLNNDIEFYQNSLKNTKNTFTNIIVLNRYIDAKLQRHAILNSLKKTLNLAKYLNFGKLPL